MKGRQKLIRESLERSISVWEKWQIRLLRLSMEFLYIIKKEGISMKSLWNSFKIAFAMFSKIPVPQAEWDKGKT